MQGLDVPIFCIYINPMVSKTKKTMTVREKILAATRKPPASGDYVWDGKDEADRPLSRAEMLKGIEDFKRTRGRPLGSGKKEQVAIRFDREVLDAFRAQGPGWQTRMNNALRDWLKRHSPAKL